MIQLPLPIGKDHGCQSGHTRREVRIFETMIKVALTGWNEGFNKVQFNQFLRDRCDLGLAEAKTIVDRVLRNERVDVEFERFSCVDRQRLIELGLKFE